MRVVLAAVADPRVGG